MGATGPANIEPSFFGYSIRSIGRWRDENGGGRFNLPEVETQGLKGPRVYDATGIPLHADNHTIIKERIHLGQANQTSLHDEITTIDHALTRPWSVIKNYRPQS